MLDGFSQPSDPNDHSKGIIFEVEGCAVHFHNTGNCPIVSKIKSQKWKAAGPKRYERTMERNNYLRHLGYEVISTWECEIDAMRKHDPEFKKFLEKRWRSVLKRNPTNQDILSSVLSKELYGFLAVDIQIPMNGTRSSVRGLIMRQGFILSQYTTSLRKWPRFS